MVKVYFNCVEIETAIKDAKHEAKRLHVSPRRFEWYLDVHHDYKVSLVLSFDVPGSKSRQQVQIALN